MGGEYTGVAWWALLGRGAMGAADVTGAAVTTGGSTLKRGLGRGEDAIG